jgi:hypothetical protein
MRIPLRKTQATLESPQLALSVVPINGVLCDRAMQKRSKATEASFVDGFDSDDDDDDSIAGMHASSGCVLIEFAAPAFNVVQIIASGKFPTAHINILSGHGQTSPVRS